MMGGLNSGEAILAKTTDPSRPLSRAWAALRRSGAAIGMWVDDHLLGVLLGSIALGAALVLLWPLMVIEIPPGHAGVLWSRFGGGTVTDKTYPEGTRLIWPWDSLTIYDIRMQRLSVVYKILTEDSLRIEVAVDTVYRPDPAKLPQIQRYVGPDYAKTLLEPIIGSEMRDALAGFTPDVGVTKDRVELEQDVQNAANRYLKARFKLEGQGGYEDIIDIRGVLINEITLPPKLAEAINAKNVAREKLETYPFLLQTEQAEAQRKAIEGQGIKAFSEAAGDGLSDRYLKLKSIEAALELAKSPNSKTIVLGGGGTGGLPLVLGDGDHK
jgi:regulator of protease activity HflC (stomatin/prohibitin superfamily)